IVMKEKPNMREPKKRAEFSEKIRADIAKQAMLICSNPNCLRFTGYGTSEGNARSIAEAAHINAAKEGGPRSESALSKGELRASKNGIWLCKICHDKVDD